MTVIYHLFIEIEENRKYNTIEKDLSDHTRGYVDGLINAQLNVYGYNFLEDAITDEWAEEFKTQAGWIPLAEDYIEDVLNSTVGISLIKPTGNNIFDINIEQKWGIGTGIIVSEKGYILTNQHLAKKRGARLIVTLNSGKSVQGKVAWVEENIDLAIIKIDETDIKPVKLRKFR